MEWPVVLLGRIDAAYMDLPPEVLTTVMRAHQILLGRVETALLEVLHHADDARAAVRAIAAGMARLELPIQTDEFEPLPVLPDQ